LNPRAVSRPDCRLPRRRRLTTAAAFEETYAQERRIIGRLMVLWLRSGPDAALRLGVVAGRKVGGAVQRNRARRRLREVFRRERHRLQGPWDVVLVARRNLLAAAWSEVQREFLALAAKAGLMNLTT
jgi:ribonuclease P protein component